MHERTEPLGGGISPGMRKQYLKAWITIQAPNPLKTDWVAKFADVIEEQFPHARVVVTDEHTVIVAK